MKWIVDLDLRPPSHAAVRFAASLAGASSAPEAARLVPVRVLDSEHLRAMLRTRHLDELIEAEREIARRIVREEAAPAAFADVQVVQALHEEQGLADSRETNDADGLIVARDDARLGKLGRVARRLVRAPPCPVVVVPASAPPAAELDGPVVVLTNLDEPSADALLFAGRVARQAGRGLLALHVVTGRGATTRPRGSPPSGPSEGEVLAWTAACGFRADGARVSRGRVVEEATAFARAERALMLVAGHRRRRPLDRVLGRSVAQALAARAERPVAIVPSTRSSAAAAREPAGARAPVHA